MRKLLLLLLAPILVFGLIVCGNKIDTDVQTDHLMQGGWVFEDGDYILYINAASMVVQYITDVSTPYRTEFSYEGERYSKADETEIKGEMTLFGYKDNVEIAILSLILTIDKEDPKNNTLEIVTIELSIEEYYYSDALPKEGTYTSLYEGGSGGGGSGSGPKPITPITPPSSINASDFTITSTRLSQNYPGTALVPADFSTATGKTKGVVSNIQYEGVSPYVYTKSSVYPPSPGQYKIFFDVAADTVNNFVGKNGLEYGDLFVIGGGSGYTTEFALATEAPVTGFSVTPEGEVKVDDYTFTVTGSPFAFVYTFPDSLNPFYNSVDITLKTVSASSKPLKFKFYSDSTSGSLLSTTDGSSTGNAAAEGEKVKFTFTLSSCDNNKVVFQIDTGDYDVDDTLDFDIKVVQVVFYTAD